MIKVSGEILHPFPDSHGEMQNLQGEIDNFLFSVKGDLLAEMDFFQEKCLKDQVKCFIDFLTDKEKWKIFKEK